MIRIEGNWEHSLTSMIEGVPRGLLTEQKRASKIAADVLVGATPEDTSRARANWTAGINIIPTEYDEKLRDRGGSRARRRMHRIIDQATFYQNIILANNTPYITHLNDGTGRTQAYAMMEQAEAAVAATVGI